MNRTPDLRILDTASTAWHHLASGAVRRSSGGTVASVRSWFPWDDEIEPGDIPHPEIVATLLGPDGEPITLITDRATIPVGFQIPHRHGYL